MVENTNLVGKTQWGKWTSEGRAAYNRMRALGFTEYTAIAEANAATLKAENARRDAKRGVSEPVVEVSEPVVEVSEPIVGEVVEQAVVKAKAPKAAPKRRTKKAD